MKRLIPAVLLIGALAAAGCAGRGEATGSQNEAADREEALLAFTECMREQGVDLPDPQTGEGERGLRIVHPESSGVGREELDKAREACAEHLEGTFQEHSAEERAEFQDRAVEFAQCMRSNGIDMPDPDFSDTDGPRGGGFRQRIEGFDPDDTDFQAADEECREEVFGADGGPGGMRRIGPGPARN